MKVLRRNVSSYLYYVKSNTATSFYSGKQGKTAFGTVLVELYNMMMRKGLTELNSKPRWPLIFLIMLSDIGQDTVSVEMLDLAHLQS